MVFNNAPTITTRTPIWEPEPDVWEPPAQQHPLSFLDSFSSHARDFLKNHPTIQKTFTPSNIFTSS